MNARIKEPVQLTGDAVHIWLAALDDSAHDPEVLAENLSEDERVRAGRRRNAEARRRFIVAHAALRDILRGYCGQPARALVFESGPHGKPGLAGATGIEFSLAHSNAYALIAVTRARPVGVDIERIRPDIRALELARRFFAPEEAAALADLTEHARVQAFFRLWTCKEAFVKALGRGFDLPLREFTVDVRGERPVLRATALDPKVADQWSFHVVCPAEGYAGAVCAQGREFEPSVHTWSGGTEHAE